MAQKIYLFLLLSLGCFSAIAQQTYDTDQNIYDESKGIVYDREFTVDMKLHTNGFALGVNFARLKTYYLTRFFNIEIGEIKHDKEFRQSFDFQTPAASRVSRAFIFGKQNNLLVLRAGIGEKRYLSEKAKRKGLAVGLSYEGGPSLGLLKPYYLELVRSESDPFQDFTIRSEKFSDANAATFLDISRIYGSSGFSKGLGEISAIPGLHGKFAVHFDWGAFDEFVKAIEAGVMVDAYFQRVPLMVESSLTELPENKSIFINLYINLQLGKRW
ncbi:MAG: hypothetical protein KDD10_15450 [Phaeodactylibacter sp.]|nr:hypothetical protein [Phaeodactylibacter sp.]MCB9295382.1 hypothetical protein [Lewinellaceae bacterium]